MTAARAPICGDLPAGRSCRYREPGIDLAGSEAGSGERSTSGGFRAGRQQWAAAALLPVVRRKMPPEGLAGHRIATLFGKVTVRLPRFLFPTCNRTETGVCWPSRCRSTPELDQLQAHLSAQMTYRVAADVLQHLLPIDAGMSPETLRHHTLRIGEQLGTATSDQPTAAAAAAITVSMDSTFIRSREDGERHWKCALVMSKLQAADGRCSEQSRRLTLTSRR
jgi:hypothetical protein